MVYILILLIWNLQKSWKPLQTLALSMQIQLMDNLIANGLDIDDIDKVCFETCNVVAKSGFYSLSFHWLNLQTQDKQTALHKAIIGKKEAVISHLLRKGANPHLQDRVRTYLVPFTYDAHWKKVRLFINWLFKHSGRCSSASLCSSSWSLADCKTTNQVQRRRQCYR